MKKRKRKRKGSSILFIGIRNGTSYIYNQLQSPRGRLQAEAGDPSIKKIWDESLSVSPLQTHDHMEASSMIGK